MANKRELEMRRRSRVRRGLRRKSSGRPRLSVFRSNKHIYAQVIDDVEGVTVAAASSLDKEFRVLAKLGATGGGDKQAASTVGKMVAERAVAKGVGDVVFDRGPYLFHGRVKALADAAREGGLSF